MAGSTADIGTGATVVFGTSGFTGQLTDVGFSMERPEISSAHMALAAPAANKFGNGTWIAGDISNVEMTMTVQLNTGQSGVTAQPPIDRVAETITVTLPKTTGDSTAATWAATGFVKSMDVSIPLEDLVTADLSIRLSGNVTVTAAA